MEGDSRRASFNGVVFWLSAAPLRSWGRWTMLQSDVDKMLAVLVQPSQAAKAKGYRTVVLDAGHGGEDPGAANARYGIQEKRITLALANATRDIIRQHGVDVRLTRTGDRAMGLPERCQYAARVQADVFVSIHLNSAVDPDSSGIETHILPPAGHPITASATVGSRDRTAYPGNSHDGANMALGYSLQKSLLKCTGAEDRGVRRSRFWVVRNAPCPAALVECGFVSNGKEARRLLDAEYQGRVARALADGVLAYLDAVRRAQPSRSSVCNRGQYDNQT
jgi:N-acetylmuramoyl-L-alanine amidase